MMRQANKEIFLKAVVVVLLVLTIGTALIGSGVAPAAYNLVENAGTPLARRSTINCVGALTCSDTGGLTQFSVAAAATTAYSQSFTAQTSVVLTDNLATVNKLVGCVNAATPAVVILPSTITITDANNTTVTFSVAQSGVCTVISGGGTGSGGGGGSSNSFGLCSALPSSGQAVGNIYKCTNQPYEFFFTSASAAQAYFYQMPVTTPAACGTFTQVNFSGVTCASSTNGPLLVELPQTAAICCSANLLSMAAPSTPYSFTTQFIPNYLGVGTASTGLTIGGLGFRDSGSGKFSACSVVFGGAQFFASYNFQHWASPTSPATPSASQIGSFAQEYGVKIVDDGTTQFCYYSLDGGANWILSFSEPRTTFLTTPDSVVVISSEAAGSSASIGPTNMEYFDLTQGVN